MKNVIYNNLINSRMLKDAREIEIFEDNLNLLADNFNENDIVELCLVLDDKTQNLEVMFGIIHLLETLSSEKTFESTIIGVVELNKNSPEWANIIIYRCLNDEFSVQMIKKIYRNLDEKTRTQFLKILLEIKNKDEKKFGKAVCEIIF